jgi:uncharacterized membrane protein (UPF0182 family)
VFGQELGFFVFVLPFWRMLHGWALALAAGTMLLTLVLYGLQRSLVLTTRGPRIAGAARTHLLLLGALLLALKAVGFWLDRYEVVFSERGIIFGAAYTDVYATLPALSVLAVLAVLAAGACVAQIARPGLYLVGYGLALLLLAWVIGLGAYPALLQRFRVSPNELAAERPFIQHNIRLTRAAYGLDRIQEREFPADEALDARALARNETTIKNIRLWDYRPLLRTFAQLQEIRTYYKFVDVDNDRYLINGEYRQLMLSPRELSYQHLQGGRNWINEHLTYTHGYGVVVGPVTRITPRGCPSSSSRTSRRSPTGWLPRGDPAGDLLRRDRQRVHPRPHSLAGARLPPRRPERLHRYAGLGGIPITSWLRRLAFAARFGEPKIILSDDITPESRILMNREIAPRIQRIAPFFRYDRDPYLVVNDAGRLIWMLDGYTTTDRYPYSDPVRGMGNYIRNSVKVTVDAYDGV